MAQGDYLIQNQSFPSFRSDLNSTLEAINTSNSGTSRPSSAVAGTVWLDTTNATNPTLKFFDGTDDISLAQLDYSANTVNWLDSSVVADLVNDTTPQLGGDLDVNGNDIVSVSNGNITFTPNGTGKVIIDGLSYPTADGTTGQFLKTDGSGNLSFDDAGGGGKVLQVVKGETNTEVGNTSTSYADTGLTATITPSATSSKILILVQQAFEIQESDGTVGGNFRLMRDSTPIYKNGPGFSILFDIGGASSTRIFNSYPMNYLDSPSSTSAITYKTQSVVYQSGDNLNSQSSGADSSIILMEIAG